MNENKFSDVSGDMTPSFIGDDDQSALPVTDGKSRSSSSTLPAGNHHNAGSSTLPAYSGIISLKPMSTGDIFSHIVTLYSERGPVLVQSMATVYLPVIVGSLLISLLAFLPMGSVIIAQSMLQICLAPLQAIAAAAAAAVVAKIVSDSFLEKEVDLWESLDCLWQKSGTVFSAAFSAWLTIMGITLSAFAVFGGMGYLAVSLTGQGSFWIIGALFAALSGLVGVATVIMASIALMFSPVIAMIEDKSWFDAPKRSFDLALRSPFAAGRLAAITIAVWIVIWLIGIGITIPVMIGCQLVASATGIAALIVLGQTLVSLGTTILLGPAAAAAAVLLYYDHKIRYENFSLDELRKKKELL